MCKGFCVATRHKRKRSGIPDMVIPCDPVGARGELFSLGFVNGHKRLRWILVFRIPLYVFSYFFVKN